MPINRTFKMHKNTQSAKKNLKRNKNIILSNYLPKASYYITFLT